MMTTISPARLFRLELRRDGSGVLLPVIAAHLVSLRDQAAEAMLATHLSALRAGHVTLAELP